jgi:hypothetical protein
MIAEYKNNYRKLKRSNGNITIGQINYHKKNKWKHQLYYILAFTSLQKEMIPVLIISHSTTQ